MVWYKTVRRGGMFCHKRLLMFSVGMLLTGQLLRAAFDVFPVSYTYHGAGRTDMYAVNGSLLNAFGDPARLSARRDIGAVFSWRRLFQIKELQHKVWSVSAPVPGFGIAVGGSAFGNPLYRESLLALMVGKTVMNRLEIGFSILRYQLWIKNYGRAGTTGLNVSWRYYPGSDWSWSTSLRNLNAPEIGRSRERLPQVITTGLEMQYRSNISIRLEWEQDLEYKGGLKFGVTCEPVPWLGFSGGYASEPAQVDAGIFFTVNKLYVDYAVVFHQQINRLSMQMGMGVSLDRP
ncbi:MAG: hypothetical protein GXO92_01120 [FCB group bacterium]|nr:hypothetical protein [FCB group bacterium]